MAGRSPWPTRHALLSLSLLFSHSFHALAAQTPSSSMVLPPLQWINLSGLTTGTPPPPRSGSSVGYDEATRSLLIFGGESAPNSPTQATYILNLTSLAWSQPPPSVSLPALMNTPPRRSRAFGGIDIVSNARDSFVLFGGQGLDGEPLDDIWSYDFKDNFWIQTIPSSNNNPSARWIGAGGTDTVRSLRNPTQANFQNTLYVFGGTAKDSSDALSDAWELTIDGTLSPNVVGSSGSVTASWKPLQWSPSLPQKIGESSAVLPGGMLVVFGGCNATAGTNANASCASQDTYILDPTTRSTSPPPSFCPAPRLSGALIPNYNGFSSAYATQAFLLFGAFDHKLWDDSNGYQKGEVAVLDTSSLLWSRVMPSGDPTGTPTFPAPRQGAAVFSWPSALVGDSRNLASDTIVFGGQNTDNGEFLSDLWILRAYNGAVTGNGQKWSGFGGGQLQGGVDASGEGVMLQYLNTCATPIPGASPSSGSGTSSSPSPTNIHGPISDSAQVVSLSRRVLQPFCLAILLLAVVSLRFYSPGISAKGKGKAILLTSSLFGIAAFASGMAGIVIAFTSKETPVDFEGSQDILLTLNEHNGLAGLILFICLQACLVVGVFAVMLWLSSCRKREDAKLDNQASNSGSPRTSSAMHSQGDRASSTWLRARTQSAGESSRMASPWPLLGNNIQQSESDDRHSTESEPPTRGFEVVNRPKHLRSRTAHLSPREGKTLPRTLSDLSWLERRRSLNAIGELDYALSQSTHERQASQQHYMAQEVNTPTIEEKLNTKAVYPRPWLTLHLIRVLFHLCLLGNLAFALVSLFQLGNRAGFAVFLVWCLAAYSVIIWAFVYKANHSLLPLLQDQFLTPEHQPPPLEKTPLAEMIEPPSSPVASHDRYQSVPSAQYTSMEYPPSTSIYSQPRAVEPDPDDEEDDEEKQLRMEQEMQRRDVSIVTVPRRQLRITNL